MRLGICNAGDLFKGTAPGHHLSILETFAYISSPFGLSDSSYISILEKFAYIFQVCHFCNLWELSPIQCQPIKWQE